MKLHDLFRQVPDIGAELTGGCYGFAAKFMHWPEELLVGGAKHNKTGHLTRAAALQTVVQLMGERELYDFFDNTYKVHNIDWSQEKASQVLKTWQRAFSNQVKKHLDANGSAPYNLYAFSTTTMNDILGKYSEVSVMKIAIGCALMVSINIITVSNAFVDTASNGYVTLVWYIDPVQFQLYRVPSKWWCKRVRFYVKK